MAKFEILPGLPPYGPEGEAFSATGQGKHREGFVVRFLPNSVADWVGNFQPGFGGCTSVFEHPDGARLIIVAGGQGYVIDPISRQCPSTFGGGIESAFEIPEHNMVIFGNGLWFEAIGETGQIWRSGRISWDGMRNLAVEGSTMMGQAWYITGQWAPFRLNILNGDFTGGSYDGPDPRNK